MLAPEAALFPVVPCSRDKRAIGVARRRYPRPRRVERDVPPVEDDALAVRRVAVAAGRDSEVPAAYRNVVPPHEAGCDASRPLIERDTVGGNRAGSRPVPPEHLAAVPSERHRHLITRQWADQLAQRSWAPNPDLLV